MKLVRLKILDKKGFRSLKYGFVIDFTQQDFVEKKTINPHIFVGPNGSGKSNVLEAIANIFYHVECYITRNLPEGLEYDAVHSPHPNAFELTYDINANQKTVRVIISKKENEAIKIYKNRKSDKTMLDSSLVQSYLPQHIVAYSTGANEILSLPFFKMRYLFYDAYIEGLVQQGGAYALPNSRLLFLSQEYSQAILLSNYLMKDESELQLFKSIVNVGNVTGFEIVLKDKIILSDEQLLEISKLIENSDIGENELFSIVETELEQKRTSFSITKAFEVIISELKKCATCTYYDNEKGELYLDYYMNDATKTAFREKFIDASQLFRVFQMLLDLNLYVTSKSTKEDLYKSDSLYVNETVPTPASDMRIMRFKEIRIATMEKKQYLLIKELSDGEHQFLHTLGLCMLYRSQNSLFLLDEPDTHFNPYWRAKFISCIKECMGTKSTNVEMLITTHTPYMVSDSMGKFVYIFNKGYAKPKHPNYNTFGASVNQITDWTFGQESSIGKYAMNTVIEIAGKINLCETRDELEQLMRQTNVLGDSVEKIVLIQQIIKRIADLG